MIADTRSGRSDINPRIASSCALATSFVSHRSRAGPGSATRGSGRDYGRLNAPANSEPPHQPHQAALNFDAIGSENAGFVRLVGRLECDRGAAAAQSLQGDLLIIDESDN